MADFDKENLSSAHMISERRSTSDRLSLSDILHGPNRYVPSSPWGPVWATVVAVAIYGVQFVGVVLVFILLATVTGGLNEERFARFDGLASTEGLVAIVFGQLVAICAIWFAANRALTRGVVLRLKPPHPSWGLTLLVGLIGAVAFISTQLALYSLAAIDPATDGQWVLAALSGENWWLVILIVVLLAPLWEELLFRGFLFSALAQTSLGLWPSAIASSSLWALLHWGYSWPGLVSVLLAGLALSWLMIRTGSMHTVVVAHGMMNAAALMAAAFVGL